MGVDSCALTLLGGDIMNEKQNPFQEYVEKLDERGQPKIEHVSYWDHDGDIYSTRTHTRHQVDLARRRIIRQSNDRVEIAHQVRLADKYLSGCAIFVGIIVFTALLAMIMFTTP